MRLFATASLMLLLPAAGVAADRYHVVTPSFGCVVPWTTWALNDGHNPHRRDPRWLSRIIDRGGCRLVSPIQEWERVGRVGRLVLLRQVPPRAGATPLLFRPSDLRVGEIAGPAPSAPDATTVPAPPGPAAASPGQPGPDHGTDAPPSAAPVPSAGTPNAGTPGAGTPAAGTPIGAAPPPAAIPSSVPGPPPGKQAPAPATPETDPSSTSATGSGPATQEPPVAATQEPPVTATPLAAPVAATAPTPSAPAPAPDAETPTPAPAVPPKVPPSAQVPTAAAPDAAAHPPAATPDHATDTPATTRTPRRRLVIGLGMVLAVLAGLAVICLRFLLGRRRDGQAAGQPPAEPFDAQPELAADEADVPPIDNNAYRRWCVDSLTEAGWQARMSFPAGRLTADIIARRDGRLLTVQCRPSTRPLEAAVVQEALVVRRAQDAQVAAVVSNAGYTRAARNLAAASGVRLLHETELPEFVS